MHHVIPCQVDVERERSRQGLGSDDGGVRCTGRHGRSHLPRRGTQPNMACLRGVLRRFNRTLIGAATRRWSS